MRRTSSVELQTVQSPSATGLTSCVHGLVEAQAARTPQRIALAFGDRTLTYYELNRRADRLSAKLTERGCTLDTLVGLAVPRSLEMVVAMLGILKAGSAYVPLDPEFPRERLDYMIQDAGLTAIVGDRAVADRLGLRDFIDVHETAAGGDRLNAPDICAAPDDLAYVIYTSGSTGRPKGVEITHRSVVNFLQSMRERPGISPDDRLVAVTTLSFDIAALEIWLPLIVGARVIVAPQSVAIDGRRLSELLHDSRATMMQATPSTWRLLVESGWAGGAGFKALCGGEQLTPALAASLLQRVDSLWNMYGPTETTIWSTVHRVQVIGEAIPIGTPIANTTIHILDATLHEVPSGETGELYIGGAGLARGYHNRSTLTAERFVPDPFAPEPGASLYRTGDLARVNVDGDLECLGRIDRQVKISGHRIEPGEVEAALETHPSVQQSAVVARNHGESDLRLVAYVVPRGSANGLRHALRAHLKQKLPAYSVPSAFVVMERLPSTPNGKIDRGALPEPDWRKAFDDEDFVAPRTPLEETLAAIWKRILGVERIGITDNFFDLGSSSLDGARLLAEMEQRFGRDLPLGALFAAPTIEQFAALVEASGIAADRNGSQRTSLVAIQAAGTQPPLFCVHGGAGTIYLYHALAHAVGPQQPLYAFQARGLYGGVAPLHDVESMAAHYIEEMRAVRSDGPYLLGGYCFGGIVAYEMAQQLRRRGLEVGLLALFNAPNYSYYAAQGGDQRVFVPDPGDLGQEPESGPPAAGMKIARPSWLRRTYWKVERARRTGSWLRRLKWRIVAARGIPVPYALRDYFFYMTHQKAERDYRPRPYDGRMLLFRAERLTRDPYLGWGGLASGGIETYGVAADDGTRDILQEPAVEGVAEILRHYLSEERTRKTEEGKEVAR